jgi:putative toxin-antitoxin system antitoxin component (TIGR02293 family)
MIIVSASHTVAQGETSACATLIREHMLTHMIKAAHMSPAQTAEVLGISMDPHPSISWMSDAVTQGLPVSAMDRVAECFAPEDKSFAYRVIPRPTLARRRSAHAALSPDEGAKVARLAEIWAFAREIWGGDEPARRFLFRPHMMFSMKRPVDLVLESEFGGRLVMDVMGGIVHGTAV